MSTFRMALVYGSMTVTTLTTPALAQWFRFLLNQRLSDNADAKEYWSKTAAHRSLLS